MPENDQPYPPDYFDDMDPEFLANDPNHECSFDQTSGDVEYIGEPDYCWGIVWECACGATQVIANEQLDDEISRDEAERQAEQEDPRPAEFTTDAGKEE